MAGRFPTFLTKLTGSKISLLGIMDRTAADMQLISPRPFQSLLWPGATPQNEGAVQLCPTELTFTAHRKPLK